MKEVYIVFNTYEFTYAGESSAMYGLMVYDIGGRGQDEVSFGNTASIVETRTNNRVRPIHFGVNYHTAPLQFKLVFGSDRELDRYELENVAFWLTGHQDYQWLTIDQPDLENVQFRCLVTQLTPIADGWIPAAFEAVIVCDCPYAYSYPFEKQYQLNGTENILFRNESSVREYVKPIITYQPLSGKSLRIVNHDDGGREFLLDNIPASSLNIVIDNDNGIIQETNNGYNLYDGFNLNFFRLVHGDNNLTVTGNGTFTLSGRFYRNVAG